MKKLTFMLISLLMAVLSVQAAEKTVAWVPSEADYTNGQELGTVTLDGGSTPEEPTVVTLPEGVTAVDYAMTATTLKNYNRVNVERTVKVGVDGVDVYMQGLAECLPEAWVKGTLTGTEVVFEGGQLLGDNNGFDAKFEPDHATITFAYDAEADKYTISAYELQAGSYTWEQYNDVVLAGDNGTVGPGIDPQPQEDFTISPAEDEQLTSLSTFVITFNNYTVRAFMGEATAKLTNTTTEQQEIVDVEVSEDGKTATMNFTETTEPGVYTLQVMDLYKGDYEFLDETLVFNYEIAGYVEPLAWTVEPASGEVSEIEAVSVKFNKNVTVDSEAMAYLFKGDEELQAKSLLPGEDYVLAIFDKVTEAGEYQMVIPEGITTVDGEAVVEIAVNYTVKEPVEPQGDWTISPEGVEQESLSVFTLTFNNYGVSNTFDEVATLVSEIANYNETAEMVVSEDKQVVTMTFPETTTPGRYTLTVPGLYISGAGQAVGDLTFNYTIPGFEEPLTWTVTPEGGEVDKIESLTIRFNKYVVVEEGAQAYLFKGDDELQAKDIIWTEGDNYVIVSFDEVTAAGEYQVVIPEGINTVDGAAVPEIAIDYTIVGEAPALTWEINPVAGEVSSIKDFTLTFNGEVSLDAYDAQAVLTGGNLEEAVKADLAISEDHKVLTFSFDEITEAGEYTLTIPEGAVFNRATFEDLAEMTFNYTIVGGVVPIEEDLPVELPAGVATETYYLTATYYGYNGSTWVPEEVSDEVQVGFDGNDVYVQGIGYYMPEAWVKGTIVDGKAVFNTGQYYGAIESEGNTYNFYFVGSEATSPYGIIDVVFTYDTETNTFTQNDDVDILEGADKDSGSCYGYYEGMVISKSAPKPNEPVVAPIDLVTEDYVFTAQELSSDSKDNPVYEDFSADVKVGFDGNDVYVQGICSDWGLPDAWVKGVKDGSTVTFETGQFFGIVLDEYDAFFVGYGASGIEDVVMNYNETTGEFTTDSYIIINNKTNSLYYFSIYTDCKLTKSGPATAIQSIEDIEEAGTVYYDALGRRTTGQAKGLLLKQVRDANGNVKTVKVARK